MNLSPEMQQELALLISQFKDKKIIQGLLTVFLKQCDGLNLVYEELRTLRWIDSSEGEQLDGLGDILVLRRDGRTDDRYREALKFKIFINVSKGQPETIIKAVKFFTNANTVDYSEIYPASSWVYTDGGDVPFYITCALQDLMPAGVPINLIGTFGHNPSFQFGEGQTVPVVLELSNNTGLELSNDTALDISNDYKPDIDTEKGFSTLVGDSKTERMHGGYFAELVTKDRYENTALKVTEGAALGLSDGSALEINILRTC